MSKKNLEFDVAKLYQLAEKENITLKLEDELYSFKKFIAHRYEFTVCFANVCLTPFYKKSILKKILPADASPLFRGIVDLLIDRGATDKIGRLSEQFTRYVARKKKIAFAEVQTVIPITEKIHNRIEKILTKITRQSIVLKEKVVPGILGGFIIKIIGGKVLDATLRHRLWDLKYQIVKAEA